MYRKLTGEVRTVRPYTADRMKRRSLRSHLRSLRHQVTPLFVGVLIVMATSTSRAESAVNEAVCEDLFVHEPTTDIAVITEQPSKKSQERLFVTDNQLAKLLRLAEATSSLSEQPEGPSLKQLYVIGHALWRLSTGQGSVGHAAFLNLVIQRSTGDHPGFEISDMNSWLQWSKAYVDYPENIQIILRETSRTRKSAQSNRKLIDKLTRMEVTADPGQFQTSGVKQEFHQLAGKILLKVLLGEDLGPGELASEVLPGLFKTSQAGHLVERALRITCGAVCGSLEVELALEALLLAHRAAGSPLFRDRSE